MNRTLPLESWGLERNAARELSAAGISAVALAAKYGTPLHVVHEERLERTARAFRASAEAAYPERVSVHYPFKCNAVPGVVQIVQRAGLKAEVMTEFELELARRLGYAGEEIIVNGPCKTDAFLRQCIEGQVRFIVVDSVEELSSIRALSGCLDREVDVLLRVNPDYVPTGLSQGSAAASRNRSPFGLDLKGGEVRAALAMCNRGDQVRFRGFHLHLGTGIRSVDDYANALRCVPRLIEESVRAGLHIETFDVGSGFASPTARGFTTFEMLLSQTVGSLPSTGSERNACFDDYTQTISGELLRYFSRGELPELIYEPGRCITSANQFLLLTIHRVKQRKGIHTWLIADGGLSTVTLPTYYEYHEVFLCNDLDRPRTERVTIIGPACFAGDIVYRNKPMPVVEPGDVIAVMDTGAYFTALESSFGFARPAVVNVRDGRSRLLRAREIFPESIARDRWTEHLLEEEQS